MPLWHQVLALVTAAVMTTSSGLIVHFYARGPGWTVLAAKLAIAATGLAYALSQPYVRRWLAAISIDQWREIDSPGSAGARSDAERRGESIDSPGSAGARSDAERRGESIDRDVRVPLPDPHLRVLTVMLTCAVSLTIQDYVGGADRYEIWFPYDGSRYWELKGFVWWSGWRVIGYVVLPLLVIACMPGERIRDYYIGGRGFFRHLWIYVVMFVALFPVVIVASLDESFRETYPFYRMANRSQFDLWTWEALYIVQFISLEFFFRGFLLHSLRRVMGANAIFVMIVPYCMIHFGKPMAETLGAIGAGLVLGTLAMRTRSIWGGVLIHCGVAITMDVLALRGCPEMGSGRYCHDG